MVDIETEIIINRSLDIVSHYAANPDTVPEWYVNIKSVQWKSEKPIKLNSEISFNAEFLGRNLEYIYKVVEFIPSKILVMRTLDGPFPMETTYTWHEIEPGITLMKLRNKGIPVGFSRLIAPFIKMAMRRANRKDLKLLKQILESKQHPDEVN